jgi:hypothetical protein
LLATWPTFCEPKFCGLLACPDELTLAGPDGRKPDWFGT